MPLYFAHQPTKGSKSQQAVSIGGEQYLPTEPSAFKITAFPQIRSALASLIYSFLGLLVVVLSRPQFTYAPTTATGYRYKKPSKLLPFRRLGHAFAIKKNFTLDPGTVHDLEAKGYTAMTLNKRTIYLKESVTSDDWSWVEEHITEIDESLMLPNRYLSHQQYLGFGILIAVTSTISAAFVRLGNTGQVERLNESAIEDITIEDGARPDELDEGEAVMDAKKFPTLLFGESAKKADSVSSWVKLLKSVVAINSTIGTYCGAAILNPFKSPKVTYLNTGDHKPTTHGLVCPFRSDLALPDVNFVGDIIATHFLSMLGDSVEEQMHDLQLIRRSLGALRLTRVGEEIAHYYKSLQIAIDAQCGLIPVFTGSTYDGSLLCGGTGFSLLIGDVHRTFDPASTVAYELDRISVHNTALKEISELFPETSRAGVLASKSMVGLRTLCLSNPFTPDTVSVILAKARSLDFGHASWQVSPDRLRSCFRILNGSDPLKPDTPIGRGALFSRDMVVVALSVFEEGQVPSWNIPSGTLRKLIGKGVPSPPPQASQKKLAIGGTDDGPWVMETRGTTLENAVEDFKLMVTQGGYRSIPSALARKQHYRVYQGERVNVFWKDMQDAYGAVDSTFKAGVRDESATVGRRSPGEAQGNPPPKKIMRMSDW